MTVKRETHRLLISPFVFTYPWRLIQHHHRARRLVEIGNLLHNVWPIEGDDVTLITCAQKLFERAPDELQLMLELRLKDAFGHHWKRIGKRRRAAFEAYMLTNDHELIANGYAYADDQLVRKRVAAQKLRPLQNM